eukprot:TRINITY_DN6707_c0_g2_i1.p1 TRINITY_DN6707_c0_g2~~TRINITY_DN6707_c0_g2_i1.p1  ORF type:complete len:418 (+),score=243.43 TRINITY_DN6707_c0_g2_i1:81-1334(+)
MTVATADDGAAVVQKGHYIVQVYPGCGGQPHILRVAEDALGLEVLQQAMVKNEERAGEGQTDEQQDPTNWELRPANGDGTPNDEAPPVDLAAELKQQGLQFPYMLTLVARLPGAGEDEVAEEAEGDEAPQRHTIREFIKMQKQQDSELHTKRMANVAKKEEERKERERRHLERCEKYELQRRQALEDAKNAKADAQKRELEAQQRKLLEAQLARERRQEEERQLLAQMKEEADRLGEADLRAKALEEQHQAREARLEKQREKKREEKAAAAAEREVGREGRMDGALGSILSTLHTSIEIDAEEIERQQAREREERMRLHKEHFEKKYIERLERERAAVKDRERHNRLMQERKQQEALERVRQQRLAQQEKNAQEEEQMYLKWKGRRAKMMEEENAVREHVALLRLHEPSQTTLPPVQ